MKLINKKILASLPPLYSTEKIPLEEKTAVVHYFNPVGKGDWYVFEGGETEDGEVMFFGWVSLFDGELGYFSLRELEEVRVFRGLLGLERDLSFEPKKFSDIKALS